MYWQKRWEFLNSIEYEFTYAGNYGAKGEKREKRKKRTPEQIRKQNMLNRTKYVRRLIKQNFGPGDYWITLKYPKGTRKPIGEVRRDMRNFIDKMRRAYKKEQDELKYIYRIEIGRLGGIHIHMILNRVRGKPPTDVLVCRAWKHGHPHFTLLYEEGGYDQLASYLTKEQGDGTEGEERHRGYVPSRNLQKPSPESKTYFRRTVEKLVKNGPVASDGYYIDRDSIVKGKNPYTGMSYLHYTEVRLVPRERQINKDWTPQRRRKRQKKKPGERANAGRGAD